MPRSSAIVRRREKLTDLGNSLTLGLQPSVNSISAVHPLTCSLLWVRCLFERYSISDFWGKWPLKWKVSKLYFPISRRDTKLRFVTKFGENRLLRSCRKVLWITTQKKRDSTGLVPAPILPKMGRLRPKFPERCHPLTCQHILNLVRIGCALLDLFRKYWLFDPYSNYSIGFEPTKSLVS